MMIQHNNYSSSIASWILDYTCGKYRPIPREIVSEMVRAQHATTEDEARAIVERVADGYNNCLNYGMGQAVMDSLMHRAPRPATWRN
jgi:hypothetical protein